MAIGAPFPRGRSHLPNDTLTDVQLLCSANGADFAAPVVTARSVGKGRGGYMNGYSTSPDYGTILRRAIFWTSARETAYHSLRTDSAHVFLYCYPSAKLLAVYNSSTQLVSTRVHVNREAIRLPPDERLRWRDVPTGQTLTGEAGTMMVDVPAGAIRFLSPSEPE